MHGFFVQEMLGLLAAGGTVSVYHVTENGWRKVSGDDVGDLHYHYYPEGNPTTQVVDPLDV